MREITRISTIQLALSAIIYFNLILKVELIQLDESQVGQWATSFKKELDAHIDSVLGYTRIQAMLRDYEKDLGIVPINGSEVFSNILLNVNIRYSDLLFAVKKIKSLIEPSRVKRQSGGPPPLSPSGSGSGGPPIPEMPLLRCCVGLAPGIYNGRFRDDVTMQECYENVDDVLKSIAKQDLIGTFKSNSDTYSVVTWQYFADAAGHYVQFPASDRLCDKSSANISSPLVSEWFVEKMHMERKNLVILVENGDSTNKAWSGPGTRRDLLTDAVKRSLATLTPSDKVNIVVFPSDKGEVGLPNGCQDKLFVATQSNLDYLTDFVQQLPYATGQANLMEGLQKVYQLFEAEKNGHEAGFTSRSNIVLLLLDGQGSPFPVEKTTLLTFIAREQLKLDNSIQHFVYTLGKPADADLIGRLAQVADQNNMKLNSSSSVKVDPWPLIPQLVFKDKPVGKEGLLDVVEDLSLFPSRVATYFQRLPPQIDAKLTTITPVFDKESGLSMTVAIPVNIHNQTMGVAAVDAALATVFSDIVNFDTGENSYTYLLDITHGDVLLHPKLRDPAETHHRDTIFPHLDVLEPALSVDQRKEILACSTSARKFEAQLQDIRPAITGELVKDNGTQSYSATVYHQLVGGTNLCVVLVHFKSDVEEARLQIPQTKVALHAPYHRIDELVPAPGGNKPDKDAVCHFYGHFLSFKESVIKLSPSVFLHPETYKYTAESFDNIRSLNSFLIADADTDLIRDDKKVLIQQTVRATDKLDALWTSNAKEVIERFYGSTSGVLRVFPGSPMENAFDHMHTDWYKRSIAFPDVTMYHYGKLSFADRWDLIIVSRALVEKGRLQGVVGMTVTPRFLTSQLVRATKECNGEDRQCHIVDTSGKFLDSLDASSDRHLNSVYPWLTRTLVKQNKLKMEWCTGFSDGYHKLTFTLTQSVTSDLGNHDPCLQFSLHSIPRTNLLILVLGNRTSLKCDDTKYEMCSSCQQASYNPIYQLSIPKCQLCLSNLTTECQCQCYCDTDIDKCQGQFTTNQTNFPTDACFYAPVDTSRPELRPGSPGPMHQLEHCPIPCVAIENLDICTALNHCKLSSDLYPTCVWKDDDELNNVNVSRFFPTTTPRQPPTPPHLYTHGSSSSGIVGPDGWSTGVPSSDASRPTAPSLPVALHTTDRPGTPSAQPGFVTSPRASPVGPIVTATHIHPISGDSSASGADISTTASLSTANSSKDESGLSGGAIAAIVLSLVAVIVLLVFVVIKLYGKKFRRPDASKYRAGSSMFDSTLFLKSQDQVSIGAAPSSTVPYQEMQIN